MLDHCTAAHPPAEDLDIDALLDFDVDTAQLPAVQPRKAKKAPSTPSPVAGGRNPKTKRAAAEAAAGAVPIAKRPKASQGGKIFLSFGFCRLCVGLSTAWLLQFDGCKLYAHHALAFTGITAPAAADDGRQLKSAVKQHKAELDALAERDPEFYAYL